MNIPAYQKLFPFSGPIMIALMGTGMVLSGLFPPIAPSSSPEQVLAFYNDNPVQVRLGFWLVVTGAALFIPWSAILADQMKRIPEVTTALVYTQFGAGVGNCLLIVLPGLMFSGVAYRPYFNPEIAYILHDMCWMVFIMSYSLGVLQFAVLGLAILCDKQAEPIFPRWAGYVNFWFATMLCPAGLITFFKVGPFTWAGVFGYYFPFSGFLVMFITMFICLRKAIAKQQIEQNFVSA